MIGTDSKIKRRKKQEKAAEKTSPKKTMMRRFLNKIKPKKQQKEKKHQFSPIITYGVLNDKNVNNVSPFTPPQIQLERLQARRALA